MTNESDTYAQAEPGKAPGSTFERKEMSFKTLRKRIALVAVAALAVTGLSTVPANAAALGTMTYTTTVTSATACTVAAPCPQGTAITMDLKLQIQNNAASGDIIAATYVLKDPNGTTITNATFTTGTAPANSTLERAGQVYTLSATGAVTAATFTLGTLSFTPTMGGLYSLTNTQTLTQATGTATLLAGTIGETTGGYYVSGIRVSQGTSIGATGEAKLANQAQVRVHLPSTASTTYKVESSGVGAIRGVADTGTSTSTISGVSTDFSAGVSTVTAANTNEHSMVITLTNAATAGIQTIRVTAVNANTGLSSALYSTTVTWSAIAALSASASIVRISAPAAAGATQNTVTPGANFTTTADAIPYAAPRAVGSRVAKIEVILINNDGTAATQGHTVTASVTGSGFVTTDNTATAADGTARSESEVLTVGSQNVAWIKISGDGTAGTGTINISVTDAVSGVTTVLPSKTVTFYGAVTKLAVTKTNFTVGRAGFTIGGANTTRVAATEIGSSTNTSTVTGGTTTTPAFIVTASDSGNRNVTTASVPTVISSDANVATGGTCVLDAGQDATYSSGLPSAGGTNSVGVYNCNWTAAANAASGSKATLTVRVADPASTTGGFLTTTVAVTIGGSISTETLSFDKASYAPGEGMVITRTAKDSAGNPVFDGATAGAITFNRPVGGTAPAAGVYIGGTSASSTSVAKASVFAPSISGAFTASMTGGDAAETVRTANATVANPVDAQITALVAAIAKLQAAINKINKRLKR